MGIFDNLKSRFNNNNSLEKVKRQKLEAYKWRVLQHLTYDEALKLAKQFISPDPKFHYVTEQGKEASRTATRDELLDVLFERAPLAEIQRILPRTKEID